MKTFCPFCLGPVSEHKISHGLADDVVDHKKGCPRVPWCTDCGEDATERKEFCNLYSTPFLGICTECHAKKSLSWLDDLQEEQKEQADDAKVP